ncbi:hypothetical protein BC827DRAFT_1121794 [Russula dissimulans]|nr:hypothetical protein BC827DRAFT_1121794 [Russula dissimulans]
MGDEQPTESTPLILRRSSVHSQLSSHSLPPLTLAPTVNHILIHGIETLDDEEPTSIFLPAHSASLAQRTSFKMIVLSQLYILAKVPPVGAGADVWEQWSKLRERGPTLDAEDLQRRVVKVWEEFLDASRNTQEIEECLWTSFPLEEGKSRTVRVLDILKEPDAPPALVSHRFVSLSLTHTWTRGRSLIPTESLILRILQRFRSAATPRFVHAVDIFLQLGYLALLSDYVLHPTERPIITRILDVIGAREVLLIIYSVASLLRPPTFLVAPFALVAGAFLFTLPSVPSPGDTSYSVLLGALLLHVFILHLPRTPSPIFLLSPDTALPLATLLWHEFVRTLYPCVFFFLPATILASFFLSIALQDSIPHFSTTFMLVEPAPMEIRMGFSVLWIILVLLTMISAVLLVLFSACFISTSSQQVTSWDRYSVAVGLRSRRNFATAVAAYSVSYYFPPPFNLLQILFVHMPRFSLQLLGWKESPVTGQIEGVLWCLTTGPLAFVVAVFWFWTGFLPPFPFSSQ